MAARVNVKFVVILSVALLCAAGAVAYVAVAAMGKSAEQHVARGDEQMAAGNYKEAVLSYSKAVNHDQRNAAWLRKWIGAMEKTTPETRNAYSDAYAGQYVPALQSLPSADRTDAGAHRRYLEEVFKQTETGGVNLQTWEHLVRVSEEMIKSFQGDEAGAKSLRRYRGLARVGVLQANPDLSASDVETARKDLEAALEVDPADAEAVVSLAAIDTTLAERSRLRGEVAEYKAGLDAARARLRAFAERNAPAPRALLALANIDLAQAARAAADTDAKASIDELIRDHQPQIQAALDAFMAQDPGKTEVTTGLALAQLAQQALPEGMAKSEAALAHAAEGHPDDPTLLITWAMMEARAGKTEQAIARLQRVVELPDVPLSFRGLLLQDQRSEAVYQQAEASLIAWERAEDAAARAKLRDAVKGYRDAVVARRGADEPRVLLLDAKLAWMNNDVGGARALLDRYNERTGERDPSALLLLGQVNRQQGNTGAARRAFERVLQLDARQVGALASLAEIAAQERDFRQAAQHARSAATLRPDNQALAQLAQRYQQLAGATDTAGADPVLADLLTVRPLVEGPTADIPAAAARLREIVASHPTDPRPARALAEILYGNLSDKAGAVRVLDEALARMPDNTELAERRALYASEDPAAQLVAKIDASESPDLSKRLAKFEVYARFGKLEEARAELAEAAKLEPAHPSVVTFQMQDALARNDAAEVDRLVGVAEANNTDQVRGLTFRARRDILEATRLLKDGRAEQVRAKLEAVEQSLLQALEMDKQNPQVHQLLGAVRMELGRPVQAVEAFAKAVEIRPNDVPTVIGYLKALVASGDAARALAVARNARNVAQSNAEFTEMWLSLEADAPGGDRAAAVAQRRGIAGVQPDNVGNRVQLAALLMQNRDFAGAAQEIESLRGKADGDTLTQLEAMLYASQNDAEKASAVLQRGIDAVPEAERTAAPYLQAGAMMMRMGQADRAGAFFEAGRRFQDPKAMEADVALGDLLFNARKLDEAVVAYKRVLDAGVPDKNDQISKRILEAMLLSGKHAQLDEMIAGMGERAQRDATLLLLAASSAEAQGNNTRAADLYDRAVAADPKSSVAFVRRADFARKDPAQLADAERDYERAAQLAPNDPTPRMRLASVYARSNRIDPAIDQLRKAVAAAPRNDELRTDLLNLLASQRRDAELMDAVDEAVAVSEGSLLWLIRGAKFATDVGRNDRAAELLGRAWDRAKSPEMAHLLVTALLNKNPPDVASAQRVLQDPVVVEDTSLPMRLVRAKVLAVMKRPADADKELAWAASVMDQNDPASNELFSNGLMAVHADPKARLEFLNKLAAQGPLRGWTEVGHGMLMLDVPEASAAGEAKLLAILDSAQDPAIRLHLVQLLSGRAYAAKRFDDAVALFRKGVEVAPENVEFSNNLAYVLAKDLGKPQEALPFAQRAVELSPGAPMILDTLGTVQLELKQYDLAAATLSRALDMARTDAERVPLAIHLGLARVHEKNTAEARRLAELAENAMAPGSPLEASYGADLKELKQRIDAQ